MPDQRGKDKDTRLEHSGGYPNTLSKYAWLGPA
jgi:hypothetical protein